MADAPSVGAVAYVLVMPGRLFRPPRSVGAVAAERIGRVLAVEADSFRQRFPMDDLKLHRPFLSSEPPTDIVFPPLKVVEVEGALIRGETGLVTLGGRVLFPEGHNIPLGLNLAKARRNSSRWLAKRTRIDGPTLSLGFPVRSSNYFHFLVDISSQLATCRRLGVDPPSLIANYELTDWQRDVLAAYGADDLVIEVPHAANIRVGKLWIVSPLECRLSLEDRVAFHRPDVLQEHATHLRESYGTGYRPRRRLFIPRKNWGRGLSNESEITRLAVSEGFELVDPGALTFAEQVRVFEEAEAVVAVHGAALTNILFAPPGCRVVDIRPTGEWVTSVFAILARNTGHEYCEVLGSGFTSGEFRVEIDSVKPYLRARGADAIQTDSLMIDSSRKFLLGVGRLVTPVS